MDEVQLMSIIFPIECRGRNAAQKEVLKVSVQAKVRVQCINDKKSILIGVKCAHIFGVKGEWCKASFVGKEKIAKGIRCPYTLDMPYYVDAEADRVQKK